MEIELIDRYVVCSRITKNYTIELEDGTTLSFEKYFNDDEYDTNSDYDFDNESKEIYDKLPEEIQEDITDFINDIRN